MLDSYLADHTQPLSAGDVVAAAAENVAQPAVAVLQLAQAAAAADTARVCSQHMPGGLQLGHISVELSPCSSSNNSRNSYTYSTTPGAPTQLRPAALGLAPLFAELSGATGLECGHHMAASPPQDLHALLQSASAALAAVDSILSSLGAVVQAILDRCVHGPASISGCFVQRVNGVLVV